MAKNTTSQWDFGELFSTATTRRVFAVSELTVQVKRLLEQQIGRVWVSGEVTNLRAQASGHLYFSLKDAAAQLSCVLFRGEARATRALLQDGRAVLVEGELTVYEPRGQYQLRVLTVELQGAGALQLAFERLKLKLQTEGLFASERKRPLPRYPWRLGLATSPTGAALQDVVHVVARRHPALEIILAPCRVQGPGAGDEVAAAIRLLNAWSAAQAGRGLDLILVTRGGGSLEDLWAFNEEVVARAIYASALPVVSAVGHEIDFTISDFVADLRAATPSAAAELITEGPFASREFLRGARNRLRTLARRRLEGAQSDFLAVRRRLERAHPRARLNADWQRLDDLRATLVRGVRFRLRETRNVWRALQTRWHGLRPRQALARRANLLTPLRVRFLEHARVRLERHRNRLASLTERLRLLSPLEVLARGYSITTDEATGTVLRAASATRPGQLLRTRLHVGEVQSVVTSKSERTSG